ncbi:MAG: adenylate/guanylate cyclase domain-containing protein [Alphaproteobacteria bacterium]|nr:adenylate/guanylate cyclase domain-containing protein [Alphaproteobacteria bacterium]
MWKQAYRSSGKTLLLIVVPVTLVVYGLSTFVPLLRQAENLLRDLRIAALTPSAPQNTDIVLVLITEETLSQFPYRSPIDRRMLATLIETIDAAKPRAIGIDILFDQPSEPTKDSRLATVLRSSDAPVVVAGVTDNSQLSAAQRKYLDEFLSSLNHGFVNIPTSRIDGTVRHALNRLDVSEGRPISFVAKIASLVGAAEPEPRFLLSYHSGHGDERAFTKFPAETVALLPKAWFRDKIVIIGSSLPFDDRHRTPVAALQGIKGEMSGVEIHAHALAQVLDGTRIWAPPHLVNVAIIAAIAMIGAMSAVSQVPLIARIAAPPGVVVGYLAVVGLCFHFFLLMLPAVAPVMACVLAAGIANGVFQQKERRLRKFIRNAFAKYVSPNLVDELVTHPEALRLQGERRDLTFLFTDLEGFTSLVERSDPERLLSLLNRYLDGMCSIVLRHGGTIDKIVGDAVTAFFGAPLPQSDHRQKAIECALEMDRFAEQFRNGADAGDVKLGKTRIGVHSGQATIGNFGGEALFDYTAHGDMVNTAARLEGANKYFGTRICVSEETASKCTGIRFRPIGNVYLKGKSVPIEVVEPISSDDISDEYLGRYRQAYALMERGSSGACNAFKALAKIDSNDPLVRLHLDRLKQGAKDASIVLEGK